MGAGAPGHDLGAGDGRADRHAGADALGREQDVRLHVPVLDGPHLAGASRARLDLVGDEQDAVAVAQLAQVREEVVLGNDVAALALDGLDDDGRELVGGHQALEDALLDLLDALVAERHVVDAGKERTEVGVVLRLRCGEADGAHRAAVEGTQERDHVRAAGVVPGQLEAGLDRLGAGVADEGALGARHGGDAGELRGGLGVDRQVVVARAEVLELVGLALDGGDDVRVAVPGGVDRDAGGEVQEHVAVDVLDGAAEAAHGHDRVGAREAGTRPGVVELDARGPWGPAARSRCPGSDAPGAGWSRGLLGWNA